MEIPTKEITLPISNAVVVLNTWITGEQADEIESVATRNIEVAPAPQQIGVKAPPIEVKKMDLDAITRETNRLTIESYVKSVNGSPEGVFEALRALPSPDYQMVKDEIAELSKKK